MELTSFNSEKKFNSKFLVEQINSFRKMEGNRTEVRHADFLSKIESEFSEEIGERKISPTSYTDASNRQSKMYELNFEQSLQILMSESKTVRKRCIDVMRSQQKPKELSRLEILQIALESEKKVLELEAKIEQDKPKVVFADSVIGSSNSILIRQFAKDLCGDGFEIGQNRVFEWLRENNYINSQNEPYQNYVSQGLFEVITRSIGSGTETFTTKTTKITGKGQIYFAEKIKKSNTLPKFLEKA